MIGADYFEAEVGIVQRVRERLPQLQRVMTPFSIGDMLESSQGSPVVHVIYAGDSVTGQAVGQGERKAIDQRWLVVLAVRHAGAQLQDTTPARGLAGPLVIALLDALQGFKPALWLRPLERINGGASPGYSASFAYFPFLFQSRIIQ